MILCFATPKGGAGKSTACAAIGSRLAQRGENVLIMDLDNETRTIESWGRKTKTPGLSVKAVARDSFTASLRDTIASGIYDHILCDLAGAREMTMLKAIARSDLVIVPAQASEPDLRQALVAISDIKDAAEAKGGPIPYRVLLTKMTPLRTRVNDFAHRELARHGLLVFRTVMVERVAYKEMFLTGVPPSSSDLTGAGGEIAALTSEIEAVVQESQTKTARRAARG
jgi:chromosome partitioning protein